MSFGTLICHLGEAFVILSEAKDLLYQLRFFIASPLASQSVHRSVILFNFLYCPTFVHHGVQKSATIY